MNDVRVENAVREARSLRRQLTRHAIGGQVIMVLVLGTLAYLDVSLKWIVVAGFFLSVGTLTGLIEEVAGRLEAGRSFLEQISADIEDQVSRSWRR
jgi:hypothetical protein